MRYENEAGEPLDENDIDLNLGRVREERRLVAHHEATPEVPEQSHWETISCDDTGFAAQSKVIDVQFQPAREAWDEYETVGVYHPFTDEELEANAVEKAESDRAKALVEQAPLAVMMLVRSQAASLSDGQALGMDSMFPEYDGTAKYKKGDIVRDAGRLYRAVNNVNASPTHPADDGVNWRLMDEPDEDGVFPWRQPYGKKDYYRKGDTVTHDGSTWVSDVNKNVWKPGVYGWHQVESSGESGEPGGGTGDAGPYEPDGEWPAYVEPTGKDTRYRKGDKVTFNGHRYVCVKNNVYGSPVEAPSSWELRD